MKVVISPRGSISWTRDSRKSLETHVLRDKLTEEQRWRSECIRQHGIEKTLDFYAARNGLVNPLEFPKKYPSCSLPRSRSLTRRGGNRLRDGAAVLEEKFKQPGYLAFDTYTFPPEFDELHDPNRISKLVSLFQDKLRYHYRNAGCEFLYQYVIEFHPRREGSEGRRIPHIHALRVAGKKKWSPIIGKHLLLKLWREACEKVYGITVSVERFRPSTRTEYVKKSAGAYMAKYLSKTNSSENSCPSMRERQVAIRQWWGMTRGILVLIRKSTKIFSGSGVRGFLDSLDSSCLFKYREVVVVTKAGYELTVGGVFYPQERRRCAGLVRFLIRQIECPNLQDSFRVV